MIKISEEDKALASRLIGGPAGLCGSVLTINSAEGTDLPAGPSAITRIVYLVAGFNSSIRAAYGKGGPVNSCCCHIQASPSLYCKMYLVTSVVSCDLCCHFTLILRLATMAVSKEFGGCGGSCTRSCTNC